jgi:dienelactone hydrolase
MFIKGVIMNWKITISALAVVIISGCNSGTEEKPIGGELLLNISAHQMKNMLTRQKWPIEGLDVFGYKAYKLSYDTTDEENKTVKASGLLVIPTGINNDLKRNGLSIVSYSHGTITQNNDAPTVFTEKYNSPIDSANIFSSLGGFATLMADYIGYGDSAGHYHPYVMERSLANASVDLIKAAKKFAKNNNIKINDKLFITGYSEGGYTAMSTFKKLEEEDINVTAAMPMAGPYDLNYMAESVLGNNHESMSGYAVAYNVLAINAYTKSYDKNISSVFNEPYASRVDKLLDGSHSFDDIERQMSTVTSELFRDNFLVDYNSNDNNWLKKAFKKNSVNHWAPKAPMILVHCEGDDQVPYAISKQTATYMYKEKGARVDTLRPDRESASQKPMGHIDCFYPSLEITAYFFAGMRDEQ